MSLLTMSRRVPATQSSHVDEIPECTVTHRTPLDFETTVRNFGPRFLAVARRYLTCEEECADVVQDALLLALQQQQRFRGLCRLETWLHRIVVNACLMRLRAKSRRPTSMLSIELVADQVATSDVQKAVDRQRDLRTALGQLPDTQKTVIQLRYFEGFSTDETAKLLGTNASVVKTRLHRSCRALRQILEQDEGD
ncbi:sigma-70 family RNA polymerase sigma factor [bacterium]|nr:sigma-70 family RNA polymerase sigma factor [bacterium]